MAKLVVPEGDPILLEIKKIAKKAGIEAVGVVTIFTDGEEEWKSVVIRFRRIPNCPRKGDRRPFSETLQELLLDIENINRDDIMVRSTPKEQGIPSGGNLQGRQIHIDRRRQSKEAFGPGSFCWQLIHELAHFFHAPFPRKKKKKKHKKKDVSGSEISTTNKIRKELGEDCYRYPDHGIEVFICPQDRRGLKAVEVDTDGKVKREAPIDVGTDPNPIVPFTGGQRLAGPGTY